MSADKGASKHLPVPDYTPSAGFAGFTLKSLAAEVVGAVWRATLGESRSVDGLVSIWQMKAGD